MEKKYRWDTPTEWLTEKIENSNDMTKIISICYELIEHVDTDIIQDIFQDEMDEDGYFDEIITIKELADQFPKMYNYYYKWENTESPELEKNLDDVLADYNYELVEEDEDVVGEYNDLKGYLNCKIKKIK